MRKAKLYEVIGEDWFHHRVHDAVLYCLSHDLTELGRSGRTMDATPLLLPPAMLEGDEEDNFGNARTKSMRARFHL